MKFKDLWNYEINFVALFRQAKAAFIKKRRSFVKPPKEQIRPPLTEGKWRSNTKKPIRGPSVYHSYEDFRNQAVERVLSRRPNACDVLHHPRKPPPPPSPPPPRDIRHQVIASASIKKTRDIENEIDELASKLRRLKAQYNKLKSSTTSFTGPK